MQNAIIISPARNVEGFAENMRAELLPQRIKSVESLFQRCGWGAGGQPKGLQNLRLLLRMPFQIGELLLRDNGWAVRIGRSELFVRLQLGIQCTPGNTVLRTQRRSRFATPVPIGNLLLFLQGTSFFHVRPPSNQTSVMITRGKRKDTPVIFSERLLTVYHHYRITIFR
jgi:hypothetical protein